MRSRQYGDMSIHYCGMLCCPPLVKVIAVRRRKKREEEEDNLPRLVTVIQ
jgi:hypothetical protein